MTDVDDEPSAYLRDRHARVAAPRHVLDDVVRRATGSTIDEVERIVRGYDNETYRLRTTSGAEICVRLRRFGAEDGDRTPEGEAWAIEQAGQAGAPVPEVLLVDRVRIDGQVVPVLVLRWMPGTPLARVEHRLSDAERATVLERMGAAFASINSVPVDGFWLPPVDGAGDWSDATSRRVMRGYVEMLRNEQADAYAGGLTADEFERTLRLVQHLADEFPCEQAVLCHNDMSPEHVIVDSDLNVTGVIDFGEWCGGSDVGDLGKLRFARPDLELSAVLRGYGSPELADETLLVRVELQALALAIGHFTHEVRIADQESLEDTRDTLRGLLDSLGWIR